MESMIQILSNNNWSGQAGTQTDKNTTHNYIDGFYENEFQQYRDKPVRVLEIGIASGHSLLLWDRYFSNHTGIYGVDNYGGNIVSTARETKNIFITIDDAYAQRVVDSLPKFDIIIDDGPHTLESMVLCIDLYLPKLNKGGVLVIEDVQSMDWIPVLNNTFDKIKNETDQSDIIDLRNTKGRYDDLMFVVRRK